MTSYHIHLLSTVAVYEVKFPALQCIQKWLFGKSRDSLARQIYFQGIIFMTAFSKETVSDCHSIFLQEVELKICCLELQK